MRLRDGMLATRDGPFGLFKAKKLAPMTPANARLPMKPEAGHKTLDLQHLPSRAPLRLKGARGRRCAGCHDDAHTKAYFASPHYDLFEREMWGCAARLGRLLRDLPHADRRGPQAGRRQDGLSSPTIRTTICARTKRWCAASAANCHGLQFALDALADPALIAKNFRDSQPSMSRASNGRRAGREQGGNAKRK